MHRVTTASILRMSLIFTFLWLNACNDGDTQTPGYTISGTVYGLEGSDLMLQNNAGDDLNISSDGNFTFVTALVDTNSYSVTVLMHPSSPNQTCAVTNGAGFLDGINITNVIVNCTTNTYTIGGTVSGLESNSLVLQNNAGDDLSISADGNFTFDTTFADNSSYSVTVLTQPSSPNQTCAVTNGAGFLDGINITNVIVNCTTNGTIGTQVGQISPDFAVFDTLGNARGLYDELSKPGVTGVVLYFTMWDPISNIHASHMRAEVMPLFPDVSFFLVDYVTGSIATSRVAQQSNGFTDIETLVDAVHAAFNLYQASMGTTVVIDSTGNIVRMNEDYKDGVKLINVLTAL